MKTKILSWLLHHANRKYKSPEFYAIKNQLLKKYGNHICYDIQFIEGKKCYTCAGTGIYSKHYDNYGFISDINYCWNCEGTGWYKLPVWNILAKIEFGKYTFHQPFQRSYKKPDNSIPIIEGYVEHKDSRYSKLSTGLLYLFYDKRAFVGWCRNFNIIDPYVWKLRRLWNKYFTKPYHTIYDADYADENLPF